MRRERGSAWLCYGLAVLAAIAGAALAARRYPGGFDWQYTVMSDLASRKHNPAGGSWFAAGLGLCAALLWPAVASIRQSAAPLRGAARIAFVALRIGLLFTVISALERIAFVHISDRIHKLHELLALLGFVGLYVGMNAFCIAALRRRDRSRWLHLAVMIVLFAIGLNLLALYIQTASLGWVDASWRTLGIPVWLSFAFWQWIAAATLLAAFGYLLASASLSVAWKNG